MSVYSSNWPIPKVCDCHKLEDKTSTMIYEVAITVNKKTSRIAMFFTWKDAVEGFKEISKETDNIDLVEIKISQGGYYETDIVMTNRF